MTRLYFVLFFLLISKAVSSQELIKPELLSGDTFEIKNFKTNSTEPLIDFRMYDNSLLSDFKSSQIKLMKFDFSQGILNFRQDYSYSVFNPWGEPNASPGFAASPFIRQANIFNQAAYRISDKFLIGGNNFGAKSIFSAPFPNAGINQFDTRGATMYLEYKVSKNIRVGASLSVTNRQIP